MVSRATNPVHTCCWRPWFVALRLAAVDMASWGTQKRTPQRYGTHPALVHMLGVADGARACVSGANVCLRTLLLLDKAAPNGFTSTAAPAQPVCPRLRVHTTHPRWGYGQPPAQHSTHKLMDDIGVLCVSRACGMRCVPAHTCGWVPNTEHTNKALAHGLHSACVPQTGGNYQRAALHTLRHTCLPATGNGLQACPHHVTGCARHVRSAFGVILAPDCVHCWRPSVHSACTTPALPSTQVHSPVIGTHLVG